ncbi:hypothetical protein NUW54_g8904 [Trametes sanguinea]|uniref:Uncharacterized protein n=1 Tax=Trametes sanguinea TaxID=158606 RepID=A0ACC1PB80_9APHY|nr:hypothetical protein NUW54_g8904 [Trametes sanguinea]
MQYGWSDAFEGRARCGRRLRRASPLDVPSPNPFPPDSSTSPLAFNGTASDPKPEQAIQYYRGSSVVLTLDGYNDTSALADNSSAPAPPIPSNIDMTLLNCLNQTIGAAVPLFDDSEQTSSAGVLLPNVSLLGLAYVIWCLSHLF